jgi:uncharacterized membrane protein
MRNNLVPHRDQPSAWEPAEEISDRDDERWLLALAASVCLFAGFRRGSLTRLLLVIAGTLLAWWAHLGADDCRAHPMGVARPA